jgi:hypothetical protein
MGFVMGISDAMASVQSVGDTVMANSACPSKAVTAKQSMDVVVDFLVSHPQMREFPAAFTAPQALAEAFPCPG